MDTLSYNLDHRPFAVNPDPSFVWLGENHQKVFQSLLSGIIDSKGFLLLTGPAGSGKTTLLTALIRSLAEDVLCAVIVDPGLDRIDFYNAIARGFGIDRRFSSKVQFLIHFSHFLHKAEGKNKKALLVVDNCHRVRPEMLEDLRLLASIEKADKKLLNIFFVGQPEFREILEKQKYRAIRQRLRCNALLPSLNVDETADYIRHRLKVAGTEEVLFTPQAVQAVHRYSQGIPRQINMICDRAMKSGSLQAKQIISAAVIESCIEKKDLPATSVDQERSINYFYKKLISRFTRVK